MSHSFVAWIARPFARPERPVTPVAPAPVEQTSNPYAQYSPRIARAIKQAQKGPVSRR
jgi:hypothetical protein